MDKDFTIKICTFFIIIEIANILSPFILPRHLNLNFIISIPLFLIGILISLECTFGAGKRRILGAFIFILSLSPIYFVEYSEKFVLGIPNLKDKKIEILHYNDDEKSFRLLPSSRVRDYFFDPKIMSDQPQSADISIYVKSRRYRHRRDPTVRPSSKYYSHPLYGYVWLLDNTIKYIDKKSGKVLRRSYIRTPSFHDLMEDIATEVRRFHEGVYLKLWYTRPGRLTSFRGKD